MKIIASAPSRVSLFGGGTDIESYSSIYGGAVLSMAINLRTHVMVRNADDLWENPYNKIPYNANPDLLYKILEKNGVGSMHFISVESKFDGRISAGLGSSASFAVALIAALRKYQNLPFDREEIAQEAYTSEVQDMQWYGGRQDQYAASYGGFNFIKFNNRVDVESLPRESADMLLLHLALFYIGGERRSFDIQREFKELTNSQVDSLDSIKRLAYEAKSLVDVGNITRLGELMDRAWKFKRLSNPKITSKEIDDIYQYALDNGAMGGKLLGAGSGGYMLFFVKPQNRSLLIQKLAEKGIENIDFSICYNGVEERII